MWAADGKLPLHCHLSCNSPLHIQHPEHFLSQKFPSDSVDNSISRMQIKQWRMKPFGLHSLREHCWRRVVSQEFLATTFYIAFPSTRTLRAISALPSLHNMVVPRVRCPLTGYTHHRHYIECESECDLNINYLCRATSERASRRGIDGERHSEHAQCTDMVAAPLRRKICWTVCWTMLVNGRFGAR